MTAPQPNASRRATGYYWVRFRSTKDPHLEVASWDATVQAWLVFGSRITIPSALETRFFEIADANPIPEPRLAKARGEGP
jgi:hypothetical protein